MAGEQQKGMYALQDYDCFSTGLFVSTEATLGQDMPSQDIKQRGGRKLRRYMYLTVSVSVGKDLP